MSVKIRLKRTGARNAPSYRVVVADARSPRDGKFLETLGWYDPKMANAGMKLDIERYAYWVAQGAQASDTVRSLAKKASRMAAEAPAEMPPDDSSSPAAVPETESPTGTSASGLDVAPAETEEAMAADAVAGEPGGTKTDA